MLGGRPRKNQEKPKKPSGLSGLSEKPRETQRNPKNPDHDNDHEYDYDNEKEQKRDTDVSPEKSDSPKHDPLNPDPEKETHPPIVPPPLPDPDFLKFQKWIQEKAPQVAKMKEPFTEEEYLRIKEEFPPGMTAEVLLAMHNCKDLLKKYVSANLTFRNWINRRLKDGTSTGRQVHEVITDPRKGDFSDDI